MLSKYMTVEFTRRIKTIKPNNKDSYGEYSMPGMILMA